MGIYLLRIPSKMNVFCSCNQNMCVHFFIEIIEIIEILLRNRRAKRHFAEKNNLPQT